MASYSRRSYNTDEDADATLDRRPKKRPRYAGASKYRQKARLTQPLPDFEDLKPTLRLRGSLHLDDRFFPYGVQSGTIIEIKGPEKSGKTFLLTYLIARSLTVYPEKKVILIDTRHKFNVKNFISILCHFDQELRQSVGGETHEERQKNLSKPIPVLFEEYPRVTSFLDRIKIIPCYSAEDLMLTFGPTGNESVIHNMLLQDPHICLVAVDCIDNFSYSESLQDSVWADQWPNIMHLLKDSVNATKCPVICTTLVPADKHVYQLKRKTKTGPKASGVTESNSNPSEKATRNYLGSTKVWNNQQKHDEPVKCANNFSLDYTAFSFILELRPVAETEKEKLVHKNVKKIYHCVVAYLRSRHNANTAGSGENQRVKFSIFSDMLWVV